MDILAIVDGDHVVHLLPFALVAQQASVTLRAYADYRVASLVMPTVRGPRPEVGSATWGPRRS